LSPSSRRGFGRRAVLSNVANAQTRAYLNRCAGVARHVDLAREPRGAEVGAAFRTYSPMVTRDTCAAR
jgi:hypothetical protein